uniref:Adaptor related protein complex 3 subunit sigma 2 n=1 Tax=Ursus americanus TaxID=9643 RepID=A0A452QNN9_URSAM
MIQAILVFNNHGKPRLVRFYQRFPEEIQQQIVRETFHLVLKRDDNICNFLEGGSLIGGSDYKLIYRHYATLYFVFCVDSSESELGILDLIQVFVETLDKCFENVCELDLIFHMDKVHYILQEVVMGGMVLETNMNEIVAQIEAQNRLEKSEGGLSAAPARAVSAVKNINLPEIPRNINIGDLNIKVPNLSQFDASVVPESKNWSERDSQDGEPLKYETDPEELSVPSGRPALQLPTPSALPPGGAGLTVRTVSRVPTHTRVPPGPCLQAAKGLSPCSRLCPLSSTGGLPSAVFWQRSAGIQTGPL